MILQRRAIGHFRRILGLRLLKSIVILFTTFRITKIAGTLVTTYLFKASDLERRLIWIWIKIRCKLCLLPIPTISSLSLKRTRRKTKDLRLDFLDRYFSSNQGNCTNELYQPRISKSSRAGQI